MHKLRALRLALTDVWDESLLVLVSGVLGALLAVLLLPLPFVFAGLYGLARRVSQRRVVSWGMLLALSRSHLRFFATWTVVCAFVSLVLASNVLFYLYIDLAWSPLAAWIMVGLLLTWLLPQPFVPALYLQETQHGLRATLRRTAVFAAMEPLAPVTLWVSLGIVAIPLATFAWPLLGILLPFMALVSTRMVQLYGAGENDV